MPGGCCEQWKALCCACSLFQIFISLDEWELEKKSLTKTRSARKKEEMEVKALNKKKKELQKQELPPMPTQHNDVTELVMTYMGDILDEDEIDLSDDDYDDDDDDDEDEKSDVDDGRKKQGGKYDAVPSKSRESSHMPTKIDVIQVTIPAGHYGGSVFQIDNGSGDVLEVIVPVGGKPGMKMQVPNTAPTSPLPPPPPQQKPTVVKDGTIQVTIPPGHFAGHIFYIQSSRGDVMEVVVPVGGQPGMKMQVPNAFSELLAPLAPVPQSSTTTPPLPPTSTSTASATATTTHHQHLHKKKSKKSKKIQVTIPDGCFGGDIFELKPAGGGENIKVRVPPGGEPGMRVQIRIPSIKKASSPSSPAPSQKEKKPTPLRKQPPVMRESPRNKQKEITTEKAISKQKQKKSTAVVTIPSGVTEGEPFVALDANTGLQVLVIVPPGAQAGMVMRAEVVEDTV